MKRIIDGVTYNTDTSTLVARSWWMHWGDQEKVQADLYLTRGGAFFVVHTRPDNDDRAPEFEPMTRVEVDEWLTQGEVELLDTTLFADPPEATAESEPEATLYIRVPRALKERVEGLAKERGVSLNTWVMRCVEECGVPDESVAEALWKAHYIANSIEVYPDGYTEQQRHDAMRAIQEQIESAWDDLDLPRCKGRDIGEDILLYRELEDSSFTREWQPYQGEPGLELEQDPATAKLTVVAPGELTVVAPGELNVQRQK